MVTMLLLGCSGWLLCSCDSALGGYYAIARWLLTAMMLGCFGLLLGRR